MFKKTTGYIIVLILAISLLSGCDKSPTDPTPSPGFEISDMAIFVKEITPHDMSGKELSKFIGITVAVDYKGAEMYIVEMRIKAEDTQCSSWRNLKEGSFSGGTEPNGSVRTKASCEVSNKGNHLVEVRLIDAKGRYSNILSGYAEVK